MLEPSQYAEYSSNFPYTQFDEFISLTGPLFDVNAL